MENSRQMNNSEKLLYFLFDEMVEQERDSLKERVSKSVCKHSLKGMNPNQINHKFTTVKCYDNDNYYIGITTKKGAELTVPLKKQYFRDSRITMLNERTVS